MKRIFTFKPNSILVQAFIICLAMVLSTSSTFSNPSFKLLSNVEDMNFSSCDNVNYGGKIGSTEVSCGSFDPAAITNIESPSGGSGALEYLWLQATDPSLPWEQWTVIPGADGNTYDPGAITETTYFLRCSRRNGCTYYYGESNIIAKIVTSNNADCPNGVVSSKKGYGKKVTIDNGVNYESNITGAPDGHVAKLYDGGDAVAVELDDTIKAGQSITITWQYRNYTSAYSGPAKLEVWCSMDGKDFSKETTLTTTVKTFLISESVTISKDARFIRIKNPGSYPDFDVDAISYCQSTCELVCDNVTNGGMIGGAEINCGEYKASLITNIELPSGGNGQIEYFWLKTNDPALPALQWDTAAIGATAGPSLDPGFITETTYFIRCSRRVPCELWEGESAPVAKVVVKNDFTCELGDGTPKGFNSGNGSTIDSSNGVDNENNALGQPDGLVAELYEDYDFIQIDLGETLKAGETYVISWKAKTQGFTANPAKLNILESTDNTDFTLANTSETFVKYTMIHETFTATKDVRYLKLQKAGGFIEIEIDAISYCKADCPECDNITYGGMITGAETNCGAFDASDITSVELPSGGSGQIEYMWLKTTNPALPALQWDTAAIGATAGPSLDPGFIAETTYFIRCSRRYPCELWDGETAPIAKIIVKSDFTCDLVAGGPANFNSGNGSSIDASNGADNTANAVGQPDGLVAELYDDNDFITIDLGETLQAGESYVISWKAKTQGFTANPAKLSIFESTNNTDFVLANTSETFVKYTMIHETFTATQEVRYIKLQKTTGFIEIEIDAISYCKADCPECDNITNGGKIGDSECNVGAYDPAEIGNVFSPIGGTGQIEYFWLSTTNPALPAVEWDTAAIGPLAGPTYDPGMITETTYFIRCSRRVPCELWDGESNAIAKVVINDTNLCQGGNVLTTSKGFANAVVSENGVDNKNSALGAADRDVAELYEDNDEIILDLGYTLKAGQSYVISWKAKTQGFTANPAKLEIYESATTSDFSYNGFIKTFVKYTTIHTNITASRDFRYLRLVKSAGYIEIEIDAVAYGKASCEYPTVCELNDHGMADKGSADRLVWLKNPISGEINEYSMDNRDSKIIQFLDGSALITGSAVNIHDACDAWTYSVRLVNKRDWAAWSALPGRTFKANSFITGEDHTTWDYYEMDDANSTFTGIDCNDGETLNLTHFPADKKYGFQIGFGANAKNGDYGLSGWFEFTGAYDGRGDFNGNIDNCVEKPATFNIGDFVWDDLNGNGIQDDGEPGIQGVQAQLIGTDFAGNGVDIVAFTGENGEYNFGPLNAGNYKVIFSNLPGAYFATKRDAGNEALDSDVDPITGMTPDTYYDGTQNDYNVDAGYIRFAEIGDFVWEDLNANGIFDFGEPMIDGVEVRLEGSDSRGESIDKTATTNENGIYFFNGLYPGDYKLTFTPAAGFEATEKNVGSDVTIDSNIDEDTNMTDVFNLKSGDSDGNFDAGFFRRVNITGIVFDDIDDNGLREGTDLPLEAITVELLRKDENGDFQSYEFDQTLADGSFWFQNLPPGEYKISTDESTLPTDYVFSLKQNVDGNLSETIDNDANDMGMISNIVLTSGQPDVDDLGIAALFNIILPVELIEFNAEVIEGNQALLTWSTANELNNKHFVIERSIDGETYSPIGLVEGNGTTNDINYYHFIDEAPFYGRNYYRLKQIDFDGQFDISEVRSIVIEADLPDAILYPNPTKDVTTLRVVSPFVADATLEIVSITGQILRTETIPMGTNSMDIDLSEYQAGFYFLNLTYDGFKRVSHRVLKVQD